MVWIGVDIAGEETRLPSYRNLFCRQQKGVWSWISCPRSWNGLLLMAVIEGALVENSPTWGCMLGFNVCCFMTRKLFIGSLLSFHLMVLSAFVIYVLKLGLGIDVPMDNRSSLEQP